MITKISLIHKVICICVIVPHRCNQRFMDFLKNLLEEV